MRPGNKREGRRLSVIGRLGGTDSELAEALGIRRQALAVRKSKNPELFDTIKKAKDLADAQVEKSLFQPWYRLRVRGHIFFLLPGHKHQQWGERDVSVAN